MTVADTPVGNGGTIYWRMGQVERRVDRIEDHNPELMASQISDLRIEVRNMKRAFYAMSASILGGMAAIIATLLVSHA